MTDTDWDALLASLGVPPTNRPRPSDKERAANTAKCSRQRARRTAKGLAPDDPRHGKPSTYTNWGCRCDKCRAANTTDCTPRVRAYRRRRAVTA